jgi:hypothetical protein
MIGLSRANLTESGFSGPGLRGQFSPPGHPMRAVVFNPHPLLTPQFEQIKPASEGRIASIPAWGH